MSQASRTFDRAAERASKDLPQQQIVRKSLVTYGRSLDAGRQRFAGWQKARELCHSIKAEAISRLDENLLRFEQRVQERGGHVFWAETAEDASHYIVGLAQSHGVKLVIKSKSMVSEEVRLAGALETAGIEAVETDLGEFIVQLRHETPYHIVTPAMHLQRPRTTTRKNASDLHQTTRVASSNVIDARCFDIFRLSFAQRPRNMPHHHGKTTAKAAAFGLLGHVHQFQTAHGAEQLARLFMHV